MMFRVEKDDNTVVAPQGDSTRVITRCTCIFSNAVSIAEWSSLFIFP